MAQAPPDADSDSPANPDRPTEPEIVNASGALAVDTASAGVSIPAAKKKRPRVFYWLAVFWLGLVVFCALFANLLPVKDPNAQDILIRLQPPGPGGILGSDDLGRDILARLVFGARVSLIVSLTAVILGSVAGGFLGLTVGFFRGWYERIVMSIVDVVLAFPALVLLLALVAYVGQSLPTIAFVVGFLAIPLYTRVARATTLAVSQREYVLAARAMGATNRRILFKELLPNVALPIAAFGLVALGAVIVVEGSLAFLGLSVKFPTATWGSMIAAGKIHIRRAPHLALIPSLAMFLTVLSINYVGDKLRQQFDVRESSL
ncbi:MAG TPA: ABC transporter permease [Acidimicrobiales bacterium]|nr:ABC transporter permease [Acidimicrobiales bacterium]